VLAKLAKEGVQDGAKPAAYALMLDSVTPYPSAEECAREVPGRCRVSRLRGVSRTKKGDHLLRRRLECFRARPFVSLSHATQM
jgi:hypothetical protein